MSDSSGFLKSPDRMKPTDEVEAGWLRLNRKTAKFYHQPDAHALFGDPTP
ncbi:MAG: hypothetical protein HC769_14345 [Cyanobacteria bacterium CRU_2_1]|nr:hypothetical protein [Cyanobacteria bacterium CRU_2_1]